MNTRSIDKPIFITTIAAIAIAGVPMVLYPEQSGAFVGAMYTWISDEVGIFYQWATIAATVVLGVIAFGKYGRTRLGGADAQKDYSEFAWGSMLFCAGVGGGLVYWSVIEWAFYMATPPFGLAPHSAEAQEWAATYGIFHWGMSAWCLYAIFTVAIAYPYYRDRIPHLKLSTSLSGLLGKDVTVRPIGRIVDFVYIIALLGGTGTSLGLATPMIGACIGRLFGIPESIALDITVLGLAVALFAFSVYLGLNRGIKNLSTINVGLALLFAVFVLVTGPTAFAVKLGSNSIGLLFQEFIRLNTWTDPIHNSAFVEDWTIFYWAWWLAYGPYVGLFVTRISRGRTLRQLILGMIGYGTAGAAVYFICIGNTAMWMDLAGMVSVHELISAGSEDTAIATIIGSLPGNPLPLAVFVFVSFVFVATTYDSASYSIAAAATRHIDAGEDPSRWHRTFWAFALAVLPIALFIIDDLSAIKSSTLVVSLPLLVIGIAMVVSLFKSLRSDETV